MEIKAFLDALGGDMIALLSGIGSVALLILGITVFHKKQLPRWIVLLVAAGCFFFSSARVWTNEHRAKLALEQQLRVLTKPILNGRIGEVTFGPAGKHNENLTAIIEAEIVNTGAPSAIDNIAAGVQLKSGRIVHLIPLDPPKVGITTEGLNGTSMFFQTSDYLPRAGTKPIPTGGILTGFLFGLLSGVTDQDAELPMTVAISFDDVYGKHVVIKRELTKRQDHINPLTIQKGTKPPRIPGK